MWRYKYHSHTSDGVKRGTCLGTDKAQVLADLTRQGHVVIALSRLSFLQQDIPLKRRPNKAELAFFCRQLYFFVETGVPLVQLDLMAQGTKGPLKQEILKLRSGLLKGRSMGASMRTGHFPKLLIDMVEMGEISGQLGQVLKQMERHYEQEAQYQKEWQSLLAYPAFVAVALVSVWVLAMVYLVPSFQVVFENQGLDLPWLTRGVMGASEFIRSFGAVWLGLGVVGVSWYAKRQWEVTGHRWPGVRRWMQVSLGARFAGSMAMMLSAGVAVEQALTLAGGLVSHPGQRRAIERLRQQVGEGTHLSAAVAGGQVFDPMLIQLMTLGEATGTMEAALYKAGEHFQRERSALLQRMKKQADPILTLIMGLFILILMMALMLPTFHLTQSI